MGQILDAENGENKDRPPARRFNLVSWFSAVSFASILLISIVVAGLLSRFLEDALLERDTAIMLQLINNMVAVSGSHEYFVNGANGGPTTDLENFFARMGEMPGVIRANAFAKDRTIIWSTERGLVGKRFDPNDELEEAFQGRPQVETGVTNTSAKLEHVDPAGR